MKFIPSLYQSSLIAILALTLSVTSSVSAGKFVPYKSKGVAGLFAQPAPGEIVSGADSGNATHLGKYESTLDLLVLPLFDGPNFVGLKFVGPTTIHAANGDLVESILDVDLDLATNSITGIYTVVGGTGRWDGASGGGDLKGAVNADGTFSYTTKGVISRPKSKK
ncbi:MAG: hypothetical protein HOH33_03655 [Verrucomicrobia bacterium]|jgi:hypothetical protein|nr:hypothetical protein [Verrucomicrobiota bacterium]